MQPKYHIFVCMEQRDPGHPKGSCHDSHGALIYEKLATAVEAQGLARLVRVTPTGCLGPCSEGTVCAVYPQATWYGKVQIADCLEIIESHFKTGNVVARLVLPEEALD